jgi:hypothetical protein
MSDMEALINQLEAFELRGQKYPFENPSMKIIKNESGSVGPSEKRWMSPDIQAGSDMTAYDQELSFTSPGGLSVVDPHSRKHDRHTSGAMCIPGAPLVTATSGYGSTLFLPLPEHQLHNDNGKRVKQMYAELGCHLASYTRNRKLDDGQYLAVHVVWLDRYLSSFKLVQEQKIRYADNMTTKLYDGLLDVQYLKHQY